MAVWHCAVQPLDIMSNIFRVYKRGEYPKPKKQFYKKVFEKRRQARNFCRNRSWEDGLTIVYPGGTEEPYV